MSHENIIIHNHNTQHGARSTQINQSWLELSSIFDPRSSSEESAAMIGK